VELEHFRVQRQLQGRLSVAVLEAAAAAAQVPVGTPVLFIDTCSLLDIPRLVERARKPGPEIDAAQRVLAAARGQTGKGPP
jgi:hypothetical protein